jgi:hypothetical protein
MIKKTIIKEITFFYYNGEIKSNTIDELIEFLNRSPKSKNRSEEHTSELQSPRYV